MITDKKKYICDWCGVEHIDEDNDEAEAAYFARVMFVPLDSDFSKAKFLMCADCGHEIFDKGLSLQARKRECWVGTEDYIEPEEMFHELVKEKRGSKQNVKSKAKVKGRAAGNGKTKRV